MRTKTKHRIQRSAVRMLDRRGYALMASLLALVALTALATIGFLVSTGDREVSANHRSTVDAFYVANAGIDQYIASHDDATVTETYSYPYGSVTVTPSEILNVNNFTQKLYRLTAVGRYTDGSGAVSTRTVTKVVMRGSVMVNAGAIVSGVPIIKNGSSGEISGLDHSGPAECLGNGDPKAGVAVPPGGYTQNGGGTPIPDGSPAIDDSRSGIDQLRQTNIDWSGILAGDVVDLGTPYSVLPNSATYTGLANDEWPVVYVDGDASAGSLNSGKGTLIVRGNLDMGGGFDWNGLVLVGGAITVNGNVDISGATVTGLNLLLGESVPDDFIANGTKIFDYNFCDVIRAKSAFYTLHEVPFTWKERM